MSAQNEEPKVRIPACAQSRRVWDSSAGVGSVNLTNYPARLCWRSASGEGEERYGSGMGGGGACEDGAVTALAAVVAAGLWWTELAFVQRTA